MSLAKRCEIFRKKLEQNLMVADMQIGQLKDYQTNLQAEILELKDKLYRFNNQIEQEKELRKGRKQRRRLKHEAQMANLKSEFQSQISNLQQQQVHEIEALQKDFEESLEKIQKDDKTQIEKLEKMYNQQISVLEKSLERTGNSLTQSFDSDDLEKSVEEETNAIMEKRIDELQQQIKEKQEERAKNLQLSKEKLSNCVQKIEEDENEHKEKLLDLKEKLDKNEENFQEKVKELKDEYQKTIPKLKNFLKEKQIRYRKVKKQVHDSRETHGQELMTLMKETDRVKSELLYYQRTSTFNSIAATTRNDNDLKQSIEINTQLGELQRQIKEKENQLIAEQNLNSELKKNIARLRFEKNLAKKKAMLFK